MYPILFKLGPITIRSLPFFWALGFVVAQILAFREAKKKGIDPIYVGIFSLLILIFALLIGSRIIYIALIHPKEILDNPLELIAFWRAGRSSFCGGIIGIIIAIFYTKRKGINFWRFADALTPAILLGAAIGKIGCLLQGCCYGKPTDLFFAIRLYGVNRHPTQIYQSLLCLVIFVIIRFTRRRYKVDGQLFLMALGILYPLARIIEEPFRADSIIAFNLIPVTSLVCILTILVASILLFYLTFSKIELQNTQRR